MILFTTIHQGRARVDLIQMRLTFEMKRLAR